jgi:hypothetical protein
MEKFSQGLDLLLKKQGETCTKMALSESLKIFASVVSGLFHVGCVLCRSRVADISTPIDRSGSFSQTPDRIRQKIQVEREICPRLTP